MAASRSLCGGFKTRVLHFKLKNTPLKDKTGKRGSSKAVRMLSFFSGGREAFHQEIVLRGIQPCFFHGGAYGLFWNATILLNFQVHFGLYGQENYVFGGEFQYEFLNVSQTFYTFFSSALKKNHKMRLCLKWILCWILPCAQPILLTWTDPRSG